MSAIPIDTDMSADFPCIEQVREEYAECAGCARCEVDGILSVRPEHLEEFDVWIAEYQQEIQTAERKRILNLLDYEDVLSRINTPEGNWIHLDTLKRLLTE